MIITVTAFLSESTTFDMFVPIVLSHVSDQMPTVGTADMSSLKLANKFNSL